MPMTPFEIAQEYKAAKNKMRQIQILADENLCSKKEIVQVLLEQGCEIPKQYLPKPKKEDPEPADPEERTDGRLKILAYDAIAGMLPQVTGEEVSIYSFIDRCYGIVELVRRAEL